MSRDLQKLDAKAFMLTVAFEIHRCFGKVA